MKAESATIVQIDEKDLVLHFADGRLFSMPVEFAPEGVRAGDCCCVAILPDINRAAGAQLAAQQMIASLTSGALHRQSKELGYYNIIMRQLGELTRVYNEGFVLKSLHHAAQTIAKALCGEKQ